MTSRSCQIVANQNTNVVEMNCSFCLMFFTNTEAICLPSEQSSRSPKCPIYATLLVPSVAFPRITGVFEGGWIRGETIWKVFSCFPALRHWHVASNAPCLHLWSTDSSHLDNKCAIKTLCVTLLNNAFMPCEVCASNQVGEFSLYCPINMSHCFILQACLQSSVLCWL